ncbi:hypothetical protein SAMD00019534_037420 [Acytostelium subglobosum LB1]|uniref:hypothetical protein n=1 Tax=Acytostelium subglobosum LB1 TaxID=1410327 RepID=UPI0006450F31|nr:hypothetical protein SAMD00019534_037420 [Acytostelium subglobosum LB1]GAM20567.1 hypothetical protein SAMD00019534_037420 [Acytostelium subglobosum LB1]|eukprot:XP_012760088.1 hypothetical protein SAMD00019534_037420 [Acytostelium subglobosum LB1]
MNNSNELYKELTHSNFIQHFSNISTLFNSNSFKDDLFALRNTITLFTHITTKVSGGSDSIPLELFEYAWRNSRHSSDYQVDEGVRKLRIQQLTQQEKNDFESEKLTEQKLLKYGPYSSLEDYLDTHYCLMREDMVHPLREAIHSHRKGQKSRYIHHDVTFKEVSCSNRYFCFKISFNNAVPKKRFDWGRTSSLLYGSLVGLTSVVDNFDYTFWATVEDRPSEGNTKEITISFVDNELDYAKLVPLLFNNTFLMVESPAYYVAYKNVLDSLQNMYELPFEDYLLNCQQQSTPPTYLRDFPTVDFATAFKRVEPSDLHDVGRSFPSRLDELDESQMAALNHCLRSEISLVQGPPGTGKTFIALKIFSLLHQHMAINLEDHERTPIVVFCYTNHALDSFVKGVLKVTTNVIRVGNRSQDPELDQFNLKHKIQKDQKQFNNYKKQGKINSGLLDCMKAMRTPIELQDILKVAAPIHANILRKLRVDLAIAWTKGIRTRMQHTRPIMKKEDKDSDASTNLDEYDEDEEAVEDLIKKRKFDMDRTNEKYDSCDIGNAMWIMEQHYNAFEDEYNILDLSEDNQENLFRHWQRKHIGSLLATMATLKTELDSVTKMILRQDDEYSVMAMKRAEVVAVTATGASKQKAVLDLLKPRLVIIEEAAEVLESQVVAILPKSTEHLIMIGDHEQLKPSNQVHQLGLKYRFNTSLFERIVRNGIGCKTLSIQRRMVPEISRFIKPIYSRLENHPSVLSRAIDDNCTLIRGMPSNIYFLTHTNPEDSNENALSKANEFEAKFVVKLAEYLIKNKYKASNIAILTPYMGQLKKIRDQCHKTGLRNAHRDLTTMTVDMFQGNEKDIIILSLVRSNTNNSYGFLSIQNRINVALSRARNAMFIVGNSTLMKRANSLWGNLIDTLTKEERIGPSLKLPCRNHPGEAYEIKSHKDFDSIPKNRGCNKQCKVPLLCGHPCASMCHYDQHIHQTMECKSLCNQVQDCGHKCEAKCHGAGATATPCPPCRQTIKLVLPDCKHQFEKQCSSSQDDQTIKCNQPCKKPRPDCGHVCKAMCGKHECDLIKCLEKVPFKLPCGHSTHKHCGDAKSSERCKVKCKVSMTCGHVCDAPCTKHTIGAKDSHPKCKKCPKPAPEGTVAAAAAVQDTPASPPS